MRFIFCNYSRVGTKFQPSPKNEIILISFQRRNSKSPHDHTVPSFSPNDKNIEKYVSKERKYVELSATRLEAMKKQFQSITVDVSHYDKQQRCFTSPTCSSDHHESKLSRQRLGKVFQAKLKFIKKD